jgi:hypothetical protein
MIFFPRRIVWLVLAASAVGCSSSDDGAAAGAGAAGGASGASGASGGDGSSGTGGSGGAGGAGGASEAGPDVSSDGAGGAADAAAEAGTIHQLCVALVAAACTTPNVGTVAACETHLQGLGSCSVITTCLACGGPSLKVECSDAGAASVVGCESVCDFDLCKDDGGGSGGGGNGGGPNDGGGNGGGQGDAGGSGGSAGGPTGTPGAIGCGTISCNAAGEHCCNVDGKMFCEPESDASPQTSCKTDAGGPGNGFVKSCDDSADCAGGGMCCGQSMNGNLVVIGCVAPTSPPAACPLFEACLPSGLACMTGKTGCTPEGQCIVQNSQTVCGSDTCSGTTNVCCAKKGDASTYSTPSCSTGQGCGPDDLTMRCTRSSECGTGEHCCRGVNSTYCRGECIAGSEAYVCTSSTDCGNSGTTCTPDTAAPTALSTCQ